MQLIVPLLRSCPFTASLPGPTPFIFFGEQLGQDPFSLVYVCICVYVYVCVCCGDDSDVEYVHSTRDPACIIHDTYDLR